MKALNLGCATNKITGAINVDISDEVKPDLSFDIRQPFPLPDNSVDKVYFFHTIEHIERKYHIGILLEIRRVLVDDGILLISYPEFKVIIQNWLNNHGNDREFWEHTVYGRQLYKGDYHVCAMDSTMFAETLFNCGFKIQSVKPEPHEVYNTVIKASKDVMPISYEELVYKEVFV